MSQLKENIRSYSVEQFKSYGNPDLIEKVVHLFIKTTKEYFINIQSALQSEDVSKINKLAHSIKPSLDMLCIYSITKVVREIESIETFDNYLLSLVDYFNSELDSVIKQMEMDYC